MEAATDENAEVGAAKRTLEEEGERKTKRQAVGSDYPSSTPLDSTKSEEPGSTTTISTATVPGPTIDQIRLLVQAREDARKDKDFAAADRIRDELRAIGVNLFDKEKIWKTNDGVQGLIPTWDSSFRSQQTATASMTSASLPTAAINVFVQARETARKQKDWAKADQIRDELKEYGITIHDREGVWKAADGRREPIVGSGQGGLMGLGSQIPYAAAMLPQQQPAYGYGGGAGYMNPMGVMPQSQAYGAAPIAPVAPYGAGGAQYGAGAGGAQAPSVSIAQYVLQREQARAARDFASADMIRNQLKQMGVELYDKEKKWKQLSTGLEGDIPMYNSIGRF